MAYKRLSSCTDLKATKNSSDPPEHLPKQTHHHKCLFVRHINSKFIHPTTPSTAENSFLACALEAEKTPTVRSKSWPYCDLKFKRLDKMKGNSPQKGKPLLSRIFRNGKLLRKPSLIHAFRICVYWKSGFSEYQIIHWKKTKAAPSISVHNLGWNK